MPPVPDAAKIRWVAGQESGDRDRPVRCRPVLGGRYTPFLAKRIRSPGHPRAQGFVNADRYWAESRTCPELQVPPESSCEGMHRLGGPRVSRVQGRLPLPPTPSLPPLHSPAPATWAPLRDLRRPRLPIRPPTGLSFQHPQPPSGVQGPRAALQPRAGSKAKLGRGPERPGCRAREKEGAPSPLGAVSMLCTRGRRVAGVLPRGAETRAPPASGPFGG